MEIDLATLRERLNTVPLGYTQKSWWEEVAQGTAIPFGTIKKIANGETEDPRISNCTALTKYLDGLLLDA